MCDSLRPLVRAHAIPEAFFREAKAGSRNLLIVGNTQGGAPRRRPIGVYDSEILCAECEGKFDKIDAYGTRVLLHEFDQLFAPVPNGGKIIAFESTQIDQEMLLRFFVAVLWRASVSTQDFYKSVNLGKFEELAAFAVTDPNAPVPFVFEALVFRWIAKSDLKMYAGSIQNPVRGRFGATNFYRLYLGMTMAVVRVSEQDLPVAMRPLRLCAQDQLFVPANDFELQHGLCEYGIDCSQCTLVAVSSEVKSRFKSSLYCWSHSHLRLDSRASVAPPSIRADDLRIEALDHIGEQRTQAIVLAPRSDCRRLLVLQIRQP